MLHEDEYVHTYLDVMFARSFIIRTSMYVDATADLFNYIPNLDHLFVHSSKAILNWLERSKELKLDVDRSIDCGSYEYLYLIESGWV